MPPEQEKQPEQEMPLWQAAALAVLVSIAENTAEIDVDLRITAASRILDHAEAPRFDFELVRDSED